MPNNFQPACRRGRNPKHKLIQVVFCKMCFVWAL